MSIRPKVILCATDFSTYAAGALAHGEALARTFGAGLLIFHAVCFPAVPAGGDAGPRRGPLSDRVRRTAEARIGELMDGCSVPWEPVVVAGDPVDEVIRVAGEPGRGVDLVITASHGLSGLRRWLLGSVVESLARTLGRPLLVTRAARRLKAPVSPFRCIVAGCGPGPDPGPAVAAAGGLADVFGARLHILHAVESPAEGLPDGEDADIPYGEREAALMAKRRQRIAEALSETVGENARPDAAIDLVPGVPGEIIPQRARELGADLIVVGVRPHPGLRGAITPSTTEAVLRHARCAVLTVPDVPESMP